MLLASLISAALFAWAPAFGEGQSESRSAPRPRPLARASPADLPPGTLDGDGGPSPVIFPPQTLNLKFDHRLHVRDLGVPCTRCHAQATTSRKGADRLLPEPAACDGCHGTDHSDTAAVKILVAEPRAACAACHEGYREGDGNRVARTRLPSPHLKFSHAAHAARNIGCAQCHGAVENVGLATREQLPRMRGCLRCHHMEGEARGDARGACDTCHVTQRGRLATHFETGQLLPPRWLNDAEHGPDWIERHKAAAAADGDFCATCHEERECIACHDGRVRPRAFHPNDWLSLHAVAADQGTPRCSSCHSQQSFCLPCHQRAGVTLSGPFENFQERGRFHPPKAVFTEGPKGALQHHGYQARRNLEACVSCHVERDCVICHDAAVGTSSSALSPHPPGFSARCGRALRANARPCFVCHDPAGPELGSCR